MSRAAFGAIALVSSLVATPAAASTVFDFTGGLAAITQTDSTRGYSFSVSDPLTVTALGLWDEDADGLFGAHTVYLWTDTGTLLASATVDNASVAVASPNTNGDWLFANINPIVLGIGTYVIGATYDVSNFDRLRFGSDAGAMTVLAMPGVTLLDYRLAFANDTFPDTTIAGFTGNFGPNLVATPLPEPSLLVLLGAGLAGVVVRRRR